MNIPQMNIPQRLVLIIASIFLLYLAAENLDRYGNQPSRFLTSGLLVVVAAIGKYFVCGRSKPKP